MSRKEFYQMLLNDDYFIKLMSKDDLQVEQFHTEQLLLDKRHEIKQ